MVSIADRGIVAMMITESRIEDKPLKYVAQYPGMSLLLQAILVRNVPSHMKKIAIKMVTTVKTVRGHHLRIDAMRICHNPLAMIGNLYPGSEKHNPPMQWKMPAI